MIVLKIVTTVLAVIANIMVTWFAVTTWFALRRLREDIRNMSRGVAVTTTLVMGSHVMGNFETVEKMKEVLRQLEDEERYEEAGRLRDAIIKAEASAENSLRRFKETCGGGIVDVAFTRFGRKRDEDEDEE